MRLHENQDQIAKSTKRFRVVNCGRRFGKTYLASEEIKGKALFSKEGSKIVYIAPTYGQAHDIMWGILKKEFSAITLKANETKLELEVMNKEGKTVHILLRGWEAIETLRGQEFVLVVLDEVASMKKFWVGWHEVLRPALASTKGDALFLSTPKGFNHFYDLYNMQNDKERGLDYESFHFTTYDNPHIAKEEIDSARREMVEDKFAQEYLADFRKQEGLVYKEFNRKYHLFDFDVIPNESEKIAGIDFGFTNPTAILDIRRDYDNNYFVVREYYKTQQTEENIAEYVANQRFNAVYPDPENPSAIKKLTDYGVNVREVIKNKDSITSGINVVRELFKQFKLKIHVSCHNLINELETYHYPENMKGDNENPEKENDHLLDALRYALSTNRPVERETYTQIVEYANQREERLRNDAE